MAAGVLGAAQTSDRVKSDRTLAISCGVDTNVAKGHVAMGLAAAA